MRVQFVLTPTESKKLISKGIVAMNAFQQALKHGTIVIHPSSTTVFILDELDLSIDPSALWICGLTVPRGLCAASDILLEVAKAKKFDPKKYTHEWVLRKGELVTKVTLDQVLSDLREDDLYIKSPNAIDPAMHAGILFTARGAGTIGQVLKAHKKHNFEIILPTGLEKLIPNSIKKVCKEAPRHGMNFCSGTPCGLLPIDGTVVTEIEAVHTLSGAEAIPIASGGVGGAEGAVILVAKGDKQQVKKAADAMADSKGAALPELRLLECSQCPRTKCHLSPALQASEMPQNGWIVPEAYASRVKMR